MEDVPEDRIHEWLGVDEPHVEMLRERVRRRVSSIDVPISDGEDAYAFFQRTMRQYRLPATMFDRVQNTVLKQERVGPKAPSGSGRILLIAAGVVALLILVLCTGDVDRWFRSDRYGPYRSADLPPAFPLLVDLILSIGTIAFGAALTGARRDAAGILMILGGGFGVMMVFIGLVASLSRTRSDFAAGYQVIRHVWQLVMLTLAFTSAVHLVRERGRTEEKGQPWAS